MKPAVWMAAASAGSAFGAIAVFGVTHGAEIVAGMAGPLVATTGSWILAERTFRRRPEQLTALMMKAFAGKLVFFGAYVAIALKGLSLDPIPFVVSFTCYFVALYLAEALCLRRLFAGAMQGR